MGAVLRLKPGQTVEIFDGQGTVHLVRLLAVSRQQVQAEVLETRRESAATASRIWPLTLAQCLLKGKKMDLLVQKATELGVQTFIPVLSRYCENHGDRDHQLERWQRIMLEACKQCHRVLPMTITPCTPIGELPTQAYVHRWAAWEEEALVGLPRDFAESGPICLLFGPEGGLHREDLASLRCAGFTTFSLGPQILRGETAALAATAIVQFATGALRPPANREEEQ